MFPTPSRRGQFGPQRYGWQDLCRGALYIATYLIYISYQPQGLRKKNKRFPHFKSMETLDPLGGTSFDPSRLIGWIYVECHYTLLHFKYIRYGPQGFREEDFYSFFHYKSMLTLDPRDGASLDPGGLIGNVYVDDF